MRADLTGRRFGRLMVKEIAGKDKYGDLWRCICDCGNEKVVPRRHLNDGRYATHSCGCLALEARRIRGKKIPHRRPPGEASRHVRFYNYARGARIRGLSFDLTEDEFAIITQQYCAYCGAEPATSTNGKGYNGQYIYNGIDRIDNTKGYSIDNIRACCARCNYMKSSLPEEAFLGIAKHMARIARNMRIDLDGDEFEIPEKAKAIIYIPKAKMR